MTRPNGTATWKWAIGVLVPIAISLFVWGVHVESSITELKQGQRVLVFEVKRLQQ